MENSETSRAFLRPRPVRVAYLVESSEHSDLMLDAIFAECNSRWGGRYSLIIPCQTGAILSAYSQWLETYDPDIIYTYVDLNEAAIQGIHEKYGPAYLIKHETHEKDKKSERYWWPSLPFECLTSLVVAPQYARAFPQSAPQPMLVIDYLPGYARERFIDNNFGSAYQSFRRWPIPEHLADSVRPLTLASEKLLKDPHGGHRNFKGETVTDTITLLQAMAKNRNTYGVAQLAADSAPHLEIRERFRESFTLVVGDSFADRILFWNDRSLTPAYLGRGFTTLIVSKTQLENADFFEALVAFIKARNSVQRSNGTPWVTLQSMSLTTDELIKLRDQFNGSDKWNGYHVGDPITLENAAPSTKILKNAFGLVTSHMFDRALNWKEFPANGKKVRPPISLPGPLQGIQSPSQATSGVWAADIDIERQNNLTRFSNVRHKWHLPRRLRMHGAFLKPYENSNKQYCYPRTSREGYLILFTGFKEEPPAINLPDDETAFRYSLVNGHDWPPFSRQDREHAPSGSYGWSHPSDKGRYLIGTLRIFGGLQEAGNVLLHKYWKNIFDDLGGAIGAARNDVIKRTLKKRLREGTIGGEDEWDRLTNLVAHEAHNARMPLRTVSFEDLVERYKPLMEEERKAVEKENPPIATEWMLDIPQSLPDSVQWLCSLNVLYQGYEWRCPKCFHSNWNQINNLEVKIPCEICATPQVIPVNKPWDFRLNGFLREALKEHGLLALIWCLIKLEDRCRDTFYFLGPHDLFEIRPRNENANRDNEADLICVVDGDVHLCEVKSSARDIEIASLIKVATRIRPDVVTLAVMENASSKLTLKFNELKSALVGMDIRAELLTLEDDDFDGRVWLPS